MKRSPLSTIRREKRAEAGGIEPRTDRGHAVAALNSQGVSPAVANALTACYTTAAHTELSFQSQCSTLSINLTLSRLSLHKQDVGMTGR